MASRNPNKCRKNTHKFEAVLTPDHRELTLDLFTWLICEVELVEFPALQSQPPTRFDSSGLSHANWSGKQLAGVNQLAVGHAICELHPWGFRFRSCLPLQIPGPFDEDGMPMAPVRTAATVWLLLAPFSLFYVDCEERKEFDVAGNWFNCSQRKMRTIAPTSYTERNYIGVE